MAGAAARRIAYLSYGTGQYDAGRSVVDDLRDAPERERHDRAPRHLRFDHDARDALDVGGEQHDVEAAEHVRDVAAVAEERNVGGDVVGVGGRFE